MEFIVNYIYTNANVHQIDAYFRLLMAAIEKGAIPARLEIIKLHICEIIMDFYRIFKC